MEFWSKGLGKRTIAMGLTKGESSVSEEALCLKGTMEEPITWEYIMLMTEEDLVDFFELLKEPNLAKYIHDSPNRWRLYAGFVVGGAQIAWRALNAYFRHRSGAAPAVERMSIELPPASVVKKKKKKRAYRRRLSTTNIDAPSLGGQTWKRDPAPSVEAQGA